MKVEGVILLPAHNDGCICDALAFRGMCMW